MSLNRDDHSDSGGGILPAITIGRRSTDANARFLASLQDKIDYAFQPIVNIRSGTCYGYEALLRGAETIGFTSIQQLFDHAYTENLLHKADILLREKAIAKFALLP
ncbi:MAG: EAL domain-containing protein, partial [Oceanibaculum nanhaiense]|nr:EAL domain-containing protein [Oceanibaculum nanhaiense]